MFVGQSVSQLSWTALVCQSRTNASHLGLLQTVLYQEGLIVSSTVQALPGLSMLLASNNTSPGACALWQVHRYTRLG